MTTETLLEAIQAPLAEELEGPQIDKLKAMATEVEFEKNQVVFRENDECQEFYLILSGRIALEMRAPGATITVQTLGPGDEFGWSSLLMRDSWHCQVRCLEHVRTLAFDGKKLLDACYADHSFGFAIMRRLVQILAGRLQASRLQLIDMASTRNRPAKE